MKAVRIGNCLLINGDCQQVIKELEDNSITLIHTDPPYIIHSSSDTGAFM
jgi:DNA modification methylase